MLGAIAIPASLAAQELPSSADLLDIPQDVVILGEDDPNVRTATAIVNGQVITGTDVEQRLALITSASQNQMDDEELRRLKIENDPMCSKLRPGTAPVTQKVSALHCRCRRCTARH